MKHDKPATIFSMNTRNHELLSKLETLLFAAGDPVSEKRIAKTLGIETNDVSSLIAELESRYRESVSGLSLVQNGELIQLGTKAENASVIRTFAESEIDEELSKAALETLSVVAYRAPVTRAEIDSIRGVNSSFSLRNLLLRGLIEREGNPDDARGYVYSPSIEFLKTLGLQKKEDLPDFEILARDPKIQKLLDNTDHPDSGKNVPGEGGGEKKSTETQ